MFKLLKCKKLFTRFILYPNRYEVNLFERNFYNGTLSLKLFLPQNVSAKIYNARRFIVSFDREKKVYTFLIKERPGFIERNIIRQSSRLCHI